jgi:hypothetical protein
MVIDVYGIFNLILLSSCITGHARSCCRQAPCKCEVSDQISLQTPDRHGSVPLADFLQIMAKREQAG